MTKSINIFNSYQQINVSFTTFLKEIINKKDEVTIALSGGTTPKLLFDFWSQNHKDDIDWQKIKFFWGDERCVPPTDEQSNFLMTKKHLFDNIKNICNENIFRIEGENNPQEESKRYQNILNSNVPTTQNGIPSFDLIILGMGDDGHTASIFPHEIELWNSSDLCVVATHPISQQKRVSFTGKLINNAQNVAFLVTGEAKSEKVQQVLSGNCKEIYPAAKVNPISQNLTWFLDNKAAKLLK